MIDKFQSGLISVLTYKYEKVEGTNLKPIYANKSYMIEIGIQLLFFTRGSISLRRKFIDNMEVLQGKWVKTVTSFSLGLMEFFCLWFPQIRPDSLLSG